VVIVLDKIYLLPSTSKKLGKDEHEHNIQSTQEKGKKPRRN
jgi:hypothetical protein